LSWTDFKAKHLFSVNLGIVAAAILWQIRKDFSYHWIIALWVVAGFLVPNFRTFERKVMLTIGKINGMILLSVFYFLFFTPFSFFYRWKLRHPSFRKLNSSFIVKDAISDFERPF
jgi:hypothetical protein